MCTENGPAELNREGVYRKWTSPVKPGRCVQKTNINLLCINNDFFIYIFWTEYCLHFRKQKHSSLCLSVCLSRLCLSLSLSLSLCVSPSPARARTSVIAKKKGEKRKEKRNSPEAPQTKGSNREIACDRI